MPSNVLRQACSFAHQFLHSVLPKVPLAGTIRLHEVFVGLGFADRNQRDIPVRLKLGRANLIPNRFESALHLLAHGRN